MKKKKNDLEYKSILTKRALMNLYQKAIFRVLTKSYGFFENLGIHITSSHFYSPLPNVNELTSEDFKKLYSCKGINFQREEQIKFLNEEILQFLKEYVPEPNTGLSLVDAFVLYAQIRLKRPKKIIEIGSGSSTLIALEALKKNRNEGADFTFYAVEPYPRSFLKEITDPDFKLEVKRVETLNLSFFADTDILFIDSSHVSKISSDVNYELLEIVPHLKSGTLIHWHDIFFPQEYPENWIRSGHQFWNESYMLQAFLAFNDSFKIKWASKYLQTFEEEILKKTFSYYKSSQNLSSLWAEKVK